MKLSCKWMLVILLFLGGKAAFSESIIQNSSQPDVSFSFAHPSSVKQHIPASYPSHGYAMLILRYNETSRDKEMYSPVTLPVTLYTVNSTLLIYNGITHIGNDLSFPEKQVRYEAYLYSLPLRSPPVSC